MEPKGQGADFFQSMAEYIVECAGDLRICIDLCIDARYIQGPVNG
jgi:hypothetical protein